MCWWLAYGILGDQARARSELDHARAILEIDFISAALWLLAAAKIVKQSGVIAVFSSVAGDRGRKSNFVYGAAKGGLALVAQGLAHDLAATGPRMIVIKPGFVITPMTAGPQAQRAAMGECPEDRSHRRSGDRQETRPDRLYPMVLALDHAGSPPGSRTDLPQDGTVDDAHP